MAGDDLVFPPVANQTATNDLPPGTAFQSITLPGESSNEKYELAGNAIVLGAGGLTVRAHWTAFRLDVTLASAQTWRISRIDLYGAVDLADHALTIETLENTILYGEMRGTGNVTVNGAGNIGLHGGASGLLTNAGPHLSVTLWAGPIVVNSGTLGFHAAGPVTVKNGAAFDTGTSNTGNGFYSSAGNLAFESGSKASFFTAFGEKPMLSVTGAVSLGGATLFVYPFPDYRAEVTIIENDGDDPVIGTFANLPDHSLLITGGWPSPAPKRVLMITYTGGDGNDVVLTYFPNPQATMTVTSSPNPSSLGEPVTFTATVTTTNGYPLRGKIGLYEHGELATGPVDASGHWTYVTTALTEGDHTIMVMYLDAFLLGNNPIAFLSHNVGPAVPQIPQATAAVPLLDSRALFALATLLALAGLLALTRL